jgi:hypothetical protein
MTALPWFVNASNSIALDLFQELADEDQQLSVQLPVSGFWYFHKLPPELRSMIWEKSLDRKPRRFVFLIEGPNPSPDFHRFYYPPLAHAVNRESRQEVFRRCIIFPQVYYDTTKANELGHGYEIVKKYIFVRPDIDILRMPMNPFALDSFWNINQPSPVSPTGLLPALHSFHSHSN